MLLLLIGFCTGSAASFYKNRIKPLPVTSHTVRYSAPDVHSSDIIDPDDGIRKININWASEKELTELPGIGPVMAKRIVAFRESSGPFETPDDIKQVKGIGNKTFEKIKPFILIAVKEDS